MLRRHEWWLMNLAGNFRMIFQRLKSRPVSERIRRVRLVSLRMARNTSHGIQLRRVVGRTLGPGVWVIGTRKVRIRNRENWKRSVSKKTVLSRGNTEWQHMNRIGREFSLSAKVLNAALMDFGSAMCVGKPKVRRPASKQCRYYSEHGSRRRMRGRPKGNRNQKYRTGNRMAALNGLTGRMLGLK